MLAGGFSLSRPSTPPVLEVAKMKSFAFQKGHSH